MNRPKHKSGILQIKKHMVTASNDGSPVGIALNSNESAYGPSPHAVSAAAATAESLKRYMEEQDRILVPALAERFGLDSERIAIGCGSDDLLARVARAYLEPGTELVRSANSYLKVPNYAYGNNALPVAAPDLEFAPDIDSILNAVTDKTRIVYLANPDNPSGSYISKTQVRRLHAGLPEHVVLVVDCAYFEYVAVESQQYIFKLALEAENVVATRTFSKVYGLAGARVGWLYGSKRIVDAVKRLSLTFPVSSPSLAAALAALDDQRHVSHVVRETLRLRRNLTDSLRALGLKVYPSQGNFVLVEFANHSRSAAEACAALRKRGIAVRRFTAPAYSDCLRITLGFEHEVRAAKAALAEFMKAGS